MLDKVKIVDMSEKRKRGGPIVAVVPTGAPGNSAPHRRRTNGPTSEMGFNWRPYIVLAALLVGATAFAATL